MQACTAAKCKNFKCQIEDDSKKGKQKVATSAMSPPRKKTKRRCNSVQYCSNLSTTVSLIKDLNLSEDHEEQLMKTPFWTLIEAARGDVLTTNMSKRSDVFIKQMILQRCVVGMSSFNVKFEGVTITKQDIRLIYGIIDGDKVIDINKKIRLAFCWRRFHRLLRKLQVLKRS